MAIKSETKTFDRMCDFVLTTLEADESKYEVLLDLAKALNETGRDWENDSMYINHPIVERVFRDMFVWTGN